MKVAMICTQVPGYGGAATSTYGAIRWLRRAGADVRGYFVDHAACKGCDWWRSAHLPFDPESEWQDPGRLGRIYKIPRCKAMEPGVLPTDCDVYVGKNYGAAQMLHGIKHAPTVYLTSGLSSFPSKDPVPFVDLDVDIGPESQDGLAASAVTEIVPHSDILAEYLQRHLCVPESPLLTLPHVPTPDMTLPDMLPMPRPHGARHFDLVMASSSWNRRIKNWQLAKYVSLRVGAAGYRVAILGLDWGPPSAHEAVIGLASHKQALRVVADSRVLAIPSFFDAAPGVYVEAVALGCNVVISRNIGNATMHPAELRSDTIEPGEFAKRVLHALELQSQIGGYRRPRPIAAAEQLLTRLDDVVKRWRGAV